MTKQPLTWNTESDIEIKTQAVRKASSFLQLAEAPMRRRPIRISFPARRRKSCLTRRALIAALREAEFDNWQATGGDALSSMHQPVY